MSSSPTPDRDQDVAAPAPVRPVAPKFPIPRVVSRPKESNTFDEEMGTELKMGEFEGVHSLSLSEANVIVKAVFERRKRERPTLVKDNEYVRACNWEDYRDTRKRKRKSGRRRENTLVLY